MKRDKADQHEASMFDQSLGSEIIIFSTSFKGGFEYSCYKSESCVKRPNIVI